jgi:hypothetical protein
VTRPELEDSTRPVSAEEPLPASAHWSTLGGSQQVGPGRLTRAVQQHDRTKSAGRLTAISHGARPRHLLGRESASVRWLTFSMSAARQT